MSPVFAKLTGVAAYLAFITGLGSLCVSLSSHVGTHAVALVSPYLAGPSERPITLVERRRREATVAVATVDPPAVELDAPGPSSRPHALVAEMGKAERVELSAVHVDLDVLDAVAIGKADLLSDVDLVAQTDLAVVATEVRHAGRSRSRQAARPTRVAAAEVFGRGFGVMLRVTR